MSETESGHTVILRVQLPEYVQVEDPGFFRQRLESVLENNGCMLHTMGATFCASHAYHTQDELTVLEIGVTGIRGSTVPRMQEILEGLLQIALNTP